MLVARILPLRLVWRLQWKLQSGFANLLQQLGWRLWAAATKLRPLVWLPPPLGHMETLPAESAEHIATRTVAGTPKTTPFVHSRPPLVGMKMLFAVVANTPQLRLRSRWWRPGSWHIAIGYNNPRPPMEHCL